MCKGNLMGHDILEIETPAISPSRRGSKVANKVRRELCCWPTGIANPVGTMHVSGSGVTCFYLNIRL